MSRNDGEWPVWTAYLFIGLMVLVGGGGLVYGLRTVRSTDDLLEFTGPVLAPLAAGFVAALVVLGVRLVTAWRLRSWSRRAEAQLQRVRSGVEAERPLPRERRATRADDESLDRVAGRLESTLVLVRGGVALPTAEALDDLREQAQGWEPEAPLTRDVEQLGALTREAPGLRRRIDRELRREERRSRGARY